ncbi:adenosine deaminase [Candidatus Poribacteria bacterium]|nr:adenosine deaminase [Candidatus Poribacteria bacterium]
MSIIQALESDNLTELQTIPKTDFHCHALLSTRRKNVEEWIGKSLAKPPYKMNGLEGMMDYVSVTLTPHLMHNKGFEFVAVSAIEDAIKDGVVILEISFDIRLVNFYQEGLNSLQTFIKSLITSFHGKIDLRPELGIARDCVKDQQLMNLAFQAIELELFKSIDLYSHEEACTPEEAKVLYTIAQKAGMKLKAHVGEFKDAEEIRRTVELLELDEVQHGIAATESVEVMKWLSENKIQLNVCPTSNVMLGGVKNIEVHPIRILYDYGIPVTINTDDLMIFDQSVSDEYRNLYQTGIFSSKELECIRNTSLSLSQLSKDK